MKKIVSCIAILSMLCGCASYRVCALDELGPQYFTQVAAAEGVRIGCKAFSKEDCLRYFDRNLLAKGYQPIQLSFRNDGDQQYYFSTTGLSLPVASAEAVAKCAHTSTALRVIGCTIGGIAASVVCLPLALVAAASGAPATVVSAPLFFNAALVGSGPAEGVRSSSANARLDKDFSEKSVSGLYVPPENTVQTVLFIPRDQYRPNFDLVLVEDKSGDVKTVRVVAK